MSGRAFLLLPLLATACGWFSFGEATTAPAGTAPAESEDPAEKLPKCKPLDYAETRGPSPWKVGDATASGWTVSAVDETNLEYIRVTFQKAGTSTILEIAYNEAGEGEWATKSYRLMPAPDQVAADDLLADAMAQLRKWQATQTEPFARRKEGIDDPYADLPPCGADGKPL